MRRRGEQCRGSPGHYDFACNNLSNVKRVHVLITILSVLSSLLNAHLLLHFPSLSPSVFRVLAVCYLRSANGRPGLHFKMSSSFQLRQTPKWSLLPPLSATQSPRPSVRPSLAPPTFPATKPAIKSSLMQRTTRCCGFCYFSVRSRHVD